MLQCGFITLLALLPALVLCHMGVIQEGAFGMSSNLDGELATPLNKDTGGIDKWMFRGLKPDSAGGSITLKPGGTVQLNLGCSKHNGQDSSGQACSDPTSGSLHLKSDGSSSGCALSISYKSFDSIAPNDMQLFSVLHACPRSPRSHSFSIPSNLPSGNATCAWHWVPPPESSADEQYMTGFNCFISGSNGGTISNAKAPLYWAANGIQLPNERPQYQNLQDGAQTLTVSGGSASVAVSVDSGKTSTTSNSTSSTSDTSSKKTTKSGKSCSAGTKSSRKRGEHLRRQRKL